MKPFNKKLNADITQLKKLHALKDKTEFNKLKAEIMERHSISKATVYRELQKDVPGLYDRKRSERPIAVKEVEMVRTLLVQQYKIQDVITVMEQRTGMPYSWDRIDKIRSTMVPTGRDFAEGSTIDNGQLTIDSEKQKLALRQAQGDVVTRPPRLTDGEPPLLSKEGSERENPPACAEATAGTPVSRLRRGTSIEEQNGSETLRQAQGEELENVSPLAKGSGLESRGVESAFGDNLRAFIDEMMDADKIGAGDYITVKLNNVPYNLSRAMVRDITMIITNYAECYLSAVQLKPPHYDKDEELLLQHLYMENCEPLSPIDELVKKQEAVLRRAYGPGGYFELDENEQSPNNLPKPDKISELNRIRIFHLVAEKIRNAVSGNFITLKELKELNEINRYFKEYGQY